MYLKLKKLMSICIVLSLGFAKGLTVNANEQDSSMPKITVEVLNENDNGVDKQSENNAFERQEVTSKALREQKSNEIERQLEVVEALNENNKESKNKAGVIEQQSVKVEENQNGEKANAASESVKEELAAKKQINIWNKICATYKSLVAVAKNNPIRSMLIVSIAMYANTLSTANSLMSKLWQSEKPKQLSPEVYSWNVINSMNFLWVAGVSLFLAL